ncbi:MAG: hypothetical protein ABUS79_05360, partial [Pseudomonadota bacterium]
RPQQRIERRVAAGDNPNHRGSIELFVAKATWARAIATRGSGRLEFSLRHAPQVPTLMPWVRRIEEARVMHPEIIV